MSLRFEHRLPERYIDIKKDSIPYEFTLDNRYFYYIQDNVYDGKLRMTLYDRKYTEENDGNGRILGKASEQLIQDFPFLWQYTENFEGQRNLDFPLHNLVIRSLDKKEYEVNKYNLGNKLVLSLEEPENLVMLRGKRPIIVQSVDYINNHIVTTKLAEVVDYKNIVLKSDVT